MTTCSYQTFAVQPAFKPPTSRKLLADQPSMHASTQASWIQKPLGSLQHLFWHLGSGLSMLLGMLQLQCFRQTHALRHSLAALDSPAFQRQSHSRGLLQSPSMTPLIALTTVAASVAPQGQMLSELKLQPGQTYYAEVTATNSAALNGGSSSATTFSTGSKPSNRSLLIAIVVLASIGVSMLLVALLTAFIVRRRCEAFLLSMCLALLFTPVQPSQACTSMRPLCRWP